MLSESVLRTHLDDGIALFFFDELPSTNDYPPAHEHAFALVVTRSQTAGRGRQSRQWTSDVQSSLTFSFYHQQATSPTIAFWQIVVANAVADCLPELRLKWPNDLIVDGGKCGGILVESQVRGDTTNVVSGIGLNIAPIDTAHADYPVTHYSLDRQDHKLCPNALIARIANQLASSLTYDVAAQMARFDARNILNGQSLSVSHRRMNDTFTGVGQGIDASARLCVMTDAGERTLDQDYKVRLMP